MRKEVKAVNFGVSAESRHGGWTVKVERGDLEQDGVVYTGMVRRVTLTNEESHEQFVELFKGSSCASKAETWFAGKTNGAFGPTQETRWMWS